MVRGRYTCGAAKRRETLASGEKATWRRQKKSIRRCRDEVQPRVIPLRNRWAASFIARSQVVLPEARECVTLPYIHSSSFFFSKDDTFCTPFRRHSGGKSRIVNTVAAKDCNIKVRSEIRL